jgi:ubiquinone/menaquinone biosynthesis C-methylase UbiE
MSTSPEPKREQPSTYVVQDRSNQEELSRLQIQDRLFTQAMGGVLPEQPDPTRFTRVLDVGCGTGAWLIELAQTTPTCKLLVGVDASRAFVEYARAQAQAAQVSDRVEFHVGDALRRLEFPTGFFDLVNQRAGMGWLRTWDWHRLLQEYQRVCHPGGVVRITEPSGGVSNSPALNRLSDLMRQALYQAGYLFTPTWDGLTSKLPSLLQQYGLQEEQTRVSTMYYRAGTPEGQHFFEDITLAMRTTLPFVRKWTQVPDDYEEIYQQMLREMQQPDFVATLDLLTVWGHPQEPSESTAPLA